MGESANRAVSRLGRTLAIGALFVVGLYLVLALFVVPRIVKSQLVTLIEDQTGIAPLLETVSFDPIRMRLTLIGFELPSAAAKIAATAAEAAQVAPAEVASAETEAVAPLDPEPAPAAPVPEGFGPILAFESLSLDLRPLGFFSADVALDSIVLLGPHVSLERDAKGALNLVELFAPKPSEETEPAASSEPLVVEIGVIRIDGGVVHFRDLALEDPFDVTLEPLSIAVSQFTTRMDTTSAYSLDLQIGDRTKLAWRGELGLTPLQSTGALAIRDFDLQLPRAYLADLFRAEIRDGFASLSGEYEFSLEEEMRLDVRKGTLVLTDLVIADSQLPAGAAAEGNDSASRMLGLPALRIEGIETDVRSGALRSLAVAEITGAKGQLAIRIDSAGRLQWTEAFAGRSSESASPSASDADPDPAPAPDPASDEVVAQETKQASSDAPEIRVARISLSDFDVTFEDASRKRPVSLAFASTQLELKGYDSRPASKLALEFETGISPKGSLSIKGPLTLEPLAGDFEVRAKQIPIAAFEAYLTEVAPIAVPSGRASGDLKLRLSTQPGGETQVHVLGDAQVEQLEIVDPARKEPVVEWKNVSLEGIDSKGSDLTLKEVRIQDAMLNVALGSDGRTNIDRLFSAEPSGAKDKAEPDKASKAAEANASPKAESILRVDRILIEGLGARFTDASIEPPFRTRLSDLKGSIDGISNQAGSLAKVKLDGRIDDSASVRIEGTLNPLRQDAATNLSLVADGVPMPLLSPYSGRYVGYGIERGKLDVRLDYQIKGRKLKAKNGFRLDRLRFGDKAPGANALSLPVPFAMALLRNAKGEVNIDLPIEGNLDDPSFDVIGLLAKTFVNLVTRVATAPFEILGSVVGLAMDDLSKVKFDPGASEISVTERAQLAELAGAMTERPSLQLDIRGQADPAVDGAALGAKAANFAQADWEDLARARALAVQTVLIDEGKLAADRVFVGGVEVGAVASKGRVAAELELRAR